MKLKLFNHTWTVHRVEGYSASSGNDGFCNADARTITIDADLDSSAATETLIHECIHAVHFTMGFDLPEEQVRWLGLGLAQLLEPLFKENRAKK